MFLENELDRKNRYLIVISNGIFGIWVYGAWKRLKTSLSCHEFMLENYILRIEPPAMNTFDQLISESWPSEKRVKFLGKVRSEQENWYL